LPQLQISIEQRRERRKNGLSAFVLLAIEWLVAGYPVTTIRRLMPPPADVPNSEALKLLDTVCALYEAEESALPVRLAQNLEDGLIPPLLAALIHRQRLL